MDPRSSSPMLLAHGAATYSLSAPGRASTPLPAIDDSFLDEGCGHEVVDGQVYELAPANEDHGFEHFHLPGLLRTCLAPEYHGAVDMLTRPKAKSNHAPDVSIVARVRDEKTGGRRVEELIFEVIDTEPSAQHLQVAPREGRLSRVIDSVLGSLGRPSVPHHVAALNGGVTAVALAMLRNAGIDFVCDAATPDPTPFDVALHDIELAVRSNVEGELHWTEVRGRGDDEAFEQRVRRCVGADEEPGEIERALDEARARHRGWRVVYAATPPVR